MKKIIFFILLTCPFVNTKAQYVSLSAAEFATLKTTINTDDATKKLYDEFQITADKALHEAPNPIKEITSEGLLAGNPDKIASLKAVEDADKVYALGLVYRISGDKAYLNKASEFLVAWAKWNKASGDPIDETKLEAMYVGYDMIRDEIAPDSRKIIDKWMDSIADAEMYSESSRGSKGTAINNWNSHRIKIIVLIAYTIHTNKYDKAIPRELVRQLSVDLYPDGTSYDFAERDAFHYHIYTLEPLIRAITAIYRATGKNYFAFESDTKSSIKKSVDFMVPYVTGEKTHPEFLNSHVAFDRERAKNGEKATQLKTLSRQQRQAYLSRLPILITAI